MTAEERKRLEKSNKINTGGVYGAVLNGGAIYMPSESAVKGSSVYSPFLQGIGAPTPSYLSSARINPYSAAIEQNNLKVGLTSTETSAPTNMPEATVTNVADDVSQSTGVAKTYDEWQNNGGTGEAAYTSYLNSIKTAEEERARAYRAALTERDLAKSTYGAEAEALRGTGLSGSGYSDYLQSKQDALYTSARAKADQTASDAKRAAEAELYSKYEQLHDAYRAELADVYNKTADELYALKAWTPDKMTTDQYDNLVTEWVDYQKKTNNVDALKAYSALSGKDLSNEKAEAKTVNMADIDFSNATVSNPTALMAGTKEQRYEIAGKLADQYRNAGLASTTGEIGVGGLQNVEEGTNFHFTYGVGNKRDKPVLSFLFGKPREKNTDSTEIIKVYDLDSDMGMLLTRIVGEDTRNRAAILDGKVYVRAKAKNGVEKWILTDEDPKSEYFV